MRRLINKIKHMIRRRKLYKNAMIGENFISSKVTNFITKNRESIIIGNNVDIHCVINTNLFGNVKIGDNTTIRYNTKISAVNSVKIGSHVIISNNVSIVDHNSHPISPTKRYEMTTAGTTSKLWFPEESKFSEVIISDNVWIGEKVTILKGVHIGEGSIVASNAVVTKDVPSYTIVAGNPARIVKNLEND